LAGETWHAEGERDVTEEADDSKTVISLRPHQKPKGETKNARFTRQARDLAVLASLPDLEYERERGAAAKRLECRPHVLDKLVYGIRSKARKLTSENASKAGWKVCPGFIGMRVNWRLDGRVVDVYVVSAVSDNEGGIHVVVVLADGNGTTCDGVISRE
jgi:hypothetical protein